LVEAAIEAVREHGAGVSVAAIAAQAGVTKPVLYRHFADRADLQRAVSEQAAALLLGNLLPQVTAGRPPIERVRSIVDAFLAATEEEPELWRFVVHNPGGTQGGSDIVAHNIALVAGLITSALVDELRTRGKDAGGAEAWAYGLAGMVYTAGDWWLQRRTMSRSALTDYLSNLIWGGLVGVLDPAETGETSENQDATEHLRLVSGLEEKG
jgi:AcrR family transcriptional regulator